MAAQSVLDNVLRRGEQEKISPVKFQWLGNDLIPRAKISHTEFLRERMRDGIGIPMALQSFNVLDKLAYGGSRLPDPSCNPYYAVGTLLAAGLDGISRSPNSLNLPYEPVRRRCHLSLEGA